MTTDRESWEVLMRLRHSSNVIKLFCFENKHILLSLAFLSHIFFCTCHTQFLRCAVGKHDELLMR